MPASCDAPLQIKVRADSNLAPGSFQEESGSSLDAGGNPSSLSGCESVPFVSRISTAVTSKMAESPSGLGFELKLPEPGFVESGRDRRNRAREDRSHAAPRRHGQPLRRERTGRLHPSAIQGRDSAIGTGTGLPGILEDRDARREDAVAWKKRSKARCIWRRRTTTRSTRCWRCTSSRRLPNGVC